MRFPFASLFIVLTFTACASIPSDPSLQFARTEHVTHIKGAPVPYVAEAAEHYLRDDAGRPAARVVTIAYTRSDAPNAVARPILFAFNGGPGASSSPLHMSAMGPLLLEGARGSRRLVANESSPLDVADLVFIDPVSTGFSRAVDGVDPRQWYNSRGDALAVLSVIDNWIKTHRREGSPRYLVGESYGATRAGNIVHFAPDYAFDGVVLVSGGGERTGPNAEDIDTIAAMAAAAWHHNEIDRADRSVEQFYAEARAFATGDYADALDRGDALTQSEKTDTARRLASYIGLSPALIEARNLRIDLNTFMFNLLADQGLRTGLLDTRVTGPLTENAQGAIDDPALGVVAPAKADEPAPTPESVGPIVSKELAAYLRDQLRFASDLPYYSVNFTANSQWRWDDQETSTASRFAERMQRDSRLRLMAVSGLYDLAGSDNSGLEQAGVPRDRLTLFQTPGPHEVYDGEANRLVFNDALRAFVSR